MKLSKYDGNHVHVLQKDNYDNDSKTQKCQTYFALGTQITFQENSVIMQVLSSGEMELLLKVSSIFLFNKLEDPDIYAEDNVAGKQNQFQQVFFS